MEVLLRSFSFIEDIEEGEPIGSFLFHSYYGSLQSFFNRAVEAVLFTGGMSINLKKSHILDWDSWGSIVSEAV
ncbi:hypothetical protein Tco_0685264 [Tanacetum coccineum]